MTVRDFWTSDQTSGSLLPKRDLSLDSSKVKFLQEHRRIRTSKYWHNVCLKGHEIDDAFEYTLATYFDRPACKRLSLCLRVAFESQESFT